MKTITNKDEAENLAIEVFTFIAQDPELLTRFLNITGIEASHIREAASTPGFLAGVLSFLLNHEPTLIKFSQINNQPPELIAKAFSFLPHGGNIEH